MSMSQAQEQESADSGHRHGNSTHGYNEMNGYPGPLPMQVQSTMSAYSQVHPNGYPYSGYGGYSH